MLYLAPVYGVLVRFILFPFLGRLAQQRPELTGQPTSGAASWRERVNLNLLYKDKLQNMLKINSKIIDCRLILNKIEFLNADSLYNYPVSSSIVLFPTFPTSFTTSLLSSLGPSPHLVLHDSHLEAIVIIETSLSPLFK